MAGLLTPARITALEASQAALVIEAGKSQAVLNDLWNEDPEHTATKHSAWRLLWELDRALKTAVEKAEAVKLYNDDDFGEWKF